MTLHHKITNKSCHKATDFAGGNKISVKQLSISTCGRKVKVFLSKDNDTDTWGMTILLRTLISWETNKLQ